MEFCSYIFWEVEKIRYFKFPSDLIDLLFEQRKQTFSITFLLLNFFAVVLCGYEGFEEFFDSDYVLFALSVQRLFGNWRKKRESKEMFDGGSSHTTGLGISLLASFLRYFTEKEIINYDM